jgi:hypothetical protein
MHKFICFILTIACFSLFSCGNKNSGSAAENDTVQSGEVHSEGNDVEGTWAPAGEDGILYHYVCPDRCIGGVLDYEGVCPICGKKLQHNTAFHFNNNNPSETPAADMQKAPRNTVLDPVQSPNGFWHFICPDGHDGGSGVEGKCATCGAELVHNPIYHTDTENADEPAQNEKGIWHFVCLNGHEGGAGAPVKCDTCGEIMVHNAEYHNQ